MCLVLFAYRRHADYPLILIANRDEYYARPTRDAHWWDDAQVLAGRDLEAGGTWLGISRDGRLAAVTNVREPGGMRPGRISRGELTRAYLSGDEHPEAYLKRLAPHDRDYAGFNLLIGDRQGLWFYSNRNPGIRRIEPGVHGISNGAFDESWPKLSSGKAELEQMLDGEISENALLEILTDHQVAPDHRLPSTGVSLDIERMLSSRFIRSPEYGTRACSVITIDRAGQVAFCEQNYRDAEHDGERVRESFTIATGP
ncbi:MAG: NRDE family protein [Gammaproteobacteria bacterium]|nr:NRDE family protein [Gammaproteobacteria bacterium]MDH3534134.1 NRDE family protein [Gammaproteobacteria bacterium]